MTTKLISLKNQMWVHIRDAVMDDELYKANSVSAEVYIDLYRTLFSLMNNISL